jgi:Leucine-rich repeat (LRR) protein
MKQTLLIITALMLVVGLAWGQDCTADDGTDGVELWGECYSIENTTELDLSYIGVTGEIPPEIGNLVNLGSLILKENQLSGEIPPEISYLTNLTQLDLGGNQLSGEIPPEIGSLTNLNILDLAGNQLTGELPPEIGNLTNLTELELGGNQVMGAIPPEIGNLESLTFIHLEYNQFTGEIPPELGSLNNLVWLNFVHNQLSGEIPSSICNLDMNWSNPNNFNISENQLCPPYPSCIEDYVGYQDTTNCDQVSITEQTLPFTYSLYNSYPNPFNPITTLRYDLPEQNHVNIIIYDMLGRQVKTLVNQTQEAGFKSVLWNAIDSFGSPVSAGVYLYQIQAGEYMQTKKMVLLK